jgi:hypothetical protein
MLSLLVPEFSVISLALKTALVSGHISGLLVHWYGSRKVLMPNRRECSVFCRLYDLAESHISRQPGVSQDGSSCHKLRIVIEKVHYQLRKSTGESYTTYEQHSKTKTSRPSIQDVNSNSITERRVEENSDHGPRHTNTTMNTRERISSHPTTTRLNQLPSRHL